MYHVVADLVASGFGQNDSPTSEEIPEWDWLVSYERDVLELMNTWRLKSLKALPCLL
jgi:hypothetical protein